MIIIHDRLSAARALRSNLDPPIRAALEAELALLTAGDQDLTDWTDIALIQSGDIEADIEREVGFSPLVDPISNVRLGEPGWDHLSVRNGVFRFVFTFGSTHASIILVPDADGILPDLLTLCRLYAA